MIHKWCVVTGTSSGIGHSLAGLLLERDWEVVGVARRESSLRHPHYHHLRLDLGDPHALTEAFDESFARAHKLDDRARVGLVNNAALLAPVGPMDQLPLAELQAAFAVNTLAPVWLMGTFQRWRASKTLRIVNVSSGAAYNPRAGWTSYCSTKAALLMAGQVLGTEVEGYAARHGATPDLGVLNYSPGIVDTEMQTQVRSYSDEQFPGVQRFQDFHAKGQLASPERPSLEIIQFLESAKAPPFTDGRFGA